MGRSLTLDKCFDSAPQCKETFIILSNFETKVIQNAMDQFYWNQPECDIFKILFKVKTKMETNIEL